MPQVQVQEVSPPSHNRAKISKEILQELQRPVSVGDLLMFGVMMFFLGIQWLFNKTRQGLAYLHTVALLNVADQAVQWFLPVLTSVINSLSSFLSRFGGGFSAAVMSVMKTLYQYLSYCLGKACSFAALAWPTIAAWGGWLGSKLSYGFQRLSSTFGTWWTKFSGSICEVLKTTWTLLYNFTTVWGTKIFALIDSALRITASFLWDSILAFYTRVVNPLFARLITFANSSLLAAGSVLRQVFSKIVYGVSFSWNFLSGVANNLYNNLYTGCDFVSQLVCRVASFSWNFLLDIVTQYLILSVYWLNDRLHSCYTAVRSGSQILWGHIVSLSNYLSSRASFIASLALENFIPVMRFLYQHASSLVLFVWRSTLSLTSSISSWVNILSVPARTLSVYLWNSIVWMANTLPTYITSIVLVVHNHVQTIGTITWSYFTTASKVSYGYIYSGIEFVLHYAMILVSFIWNSAASVIKFSSGHLFTVTSFISRHITSLVKFVWESSASVLDYSTRLVHFIVQICISIYNSVSPYLVSLWNYLDMFVQYCHSKLVWVLAKTFDVLLTIFFYVLSIPSKIIDGFLLLVNLISNFPRCSICKRGYAKLRSMCFTCTLNYYIPRCIQCDKGYAKLTSLCFTCFWHSVFKICSKCAQRYAIFGSICFMCKLDALFARCAVCTRGYAKFGSLCFTCKLNSLLARCAACGRGYAKFGSLCFTCKLNSLLAVCSLCTRGYAKFGSLCFTCKLNALLARCAACGRGYAKFGPLCFTCKLNSLLAVCSLCKIGYAKFGPLCMTCKINSMFSVCGVCRKGYAKVGPRCLTCFLEFVKNPPVCRMCKRGLSKIGFYCISCQFQLLSSRYGFSKPVPSEVRKKKEKDSRDPKKEGEDKEKCKEKHKEEQTEDKVKEAPQLGVKQLKRRRVAHPEPPAGAGVTSE